MEEPGVEDATRRTRLANERTYLAWWRTGLTALAVAVGVGRLVPGVGHHVTKWPYELLGVGFAILGIGFVVGGYVRERAVEEALNRRNFSPLDDRLAAGLTAAGLVLGLATIVLVAFVR
jgi:putative membrane protein